MKQALLKQLLQERLTTAKLGILVRGIDGLREEALIAELAEATGRHIYAAVVGYGVSENETDSYSIASTIERAVLWRSIPSCAGGILVLLRGETDKLHSLAELDSITISDLTRCLIDRQLQGEVNSPTSSFWSALKDISEYYSYEAMEQYVAKVRESSKPAEAIGTNMYLINLLPDQGILSTNVIARDRLRRNRELIMAMAQLSEDSRKRLNRSINRAEETDKLRLQKAYRYLQEYFKYGRQEALSKLDFSTVQEMLSAAKAKKKEPPAPSPDDPVEPNPEQPIRARELNEIVNDAIVEGGEEAEEALADLVHNLEEAFEDEERPGTVTAKGEIFEDREIVMEKGSTELRALVGRVCATNAWGGLLQTEERTLRDIVSSEYTELDLFDPNDEKSVISYSDAAIFEFLRRFDEHLLENDEEAELFGPVIERIVASRNRLVARLDMILYYPVLLFAAEHEARGDLIEYIEAWTELYRCYGRNEIRMKEVSPEGTRYMVRALLLLDVLYIKTPTEWKAILLPLNPMYLWRFYELFRKPQMGDQLSEENAKALKEVLSRLPQVMNFIIVDKMLTHQMDATLPCSGAIEMLPSFENKTNRYLGDDGVQVIPEVITRWVGFAPFTRNEVRLCTIDAPDLLGTLRAIRGLLEKDVCQRIVLTVYYTREQNANNELSRLDYAGKDYLIGEYIKQERISIRIAQSDTRRIREELKEKPVHIAIFFDQCSYKIEYGPDNQNLNINPLVVSYEYNYDKLAKKGKIYPSTDTDSGLIGEYHRMMRAADLISQDMIPITATNSSVSVSDVIMTIQDSGTQWLVAADRDISNYVPESAVPIGEIQFDRRSIGIWASRSSRIIKQYMDMLRAYNLYPKQEKLVEILSTFGHIAANGLISIPRYGADMTAIDNRRKGLLGTLFAAAWYTTEHKNALVASLDTDKARLWLLNNGYGNDRADLIGLYYEEEQNTLHIEPIEVKTRDEDDATDICHIKGTNCTELTGHAPDQVAEIMEMLRDIFGADAEEATDIFLSARREVLKYQIVTECFRSIHDPDWQFRWSELLHKAFKAGNSGLTVAITGMVIHFKMSDATGGFDLDGCIHPEHEGCCIRFKRFSAKDIQEQILGESDKQEFVNIIVDRTRQGDAEAYIDRDIDEIPSIHRLREEPSISVPVPEKKEQRVEEDFSREIEELARDFMRFSADFNIRIKECLPERAVVGPGLIRLAFTLQRGESQSHLQGQLQNIGRQMRRSGLLIQEVQNSDELLLDVPRLKRDPVLYRDVIDRLPVTTSPEQLWFPVGRTPNGEDLIKNLGEMPHMLVGGSTGSGKSVFLFTLLASLLLTHPSKEDMTLILSSSKPEDFCHFDRLPHLYSGGIISDAQEATRVISEVVYRESERRGKLLAEARVANIIEYNKQAMVKLAPIVVVIDEYADLVDQLSTKKERDAFTTPVRRIAQAGRSRGIHLVVCTQRPESKLVDSSIKAQLNARVALRVNDYNSSRMILEESGAQELQKHGDMIFKLDGGKERAQGYLITIPELDDIVARIINGGR